MAYETRFAIRALSISNLTWTDVVGSTTLPIDCNTILVMNDTGQSILLRTDPANANSQITIADGQSFTIGGASLRPAPDARFARGSVHPACSLQAATSPVSPLIISIL